MVLRLGIQGTVLVNLSMDCPYIIAWGNGVLFLNIYIEKGLKSNWWFLNATCPMAYPIDTCSGSHNFFLLASTKVRKWKTHTCETAKLTSPCLQNQYLSGILRTKAPCVLSSFLYIASHCWGLVMVHVSKFFLCDSNGIHHFISKYVVYTITLLVV